jgi:hypothetical protein
MNKLTASTVFFALVVIFTRRLNVVQRRNVYRHQNR